MLHALDVSAFLCGIVNRSDFSDHDKCVIRFFAAVCMVRYLSLFPHGASGGSILSLSLAGC